MRALTLWRPWPFAFFHLANEDRKPLENRGWAPPASVIGTRIALHAGKMWHEPSAASIPGALTDPRARAEGIAGTVLVRGWIEEDPRGEEFTRHVGVSLSEANVLIRSRWFISLPDRHTFAQKRAVAWLTDEPRALDEPIACKGAQGLWSVPSDIADAISSSTASP